MTTSINIQKSSINIISQLLKLEGKQFSQPTWFKKTAVNFKKKFGIELQGAPLIFVANGCIWKLSFIQGNYSAKLGGHKFESADYLPIVGCKNKFKRMERLDIYNKIYNIK